MSQVLDMTLKLDPCQGNMRAKLFEMGAVIAEKTEDDGTLNLHIRIESESLKRLATQTGMSLDALGIPNNQSDDPITQNSYSPI